MSGSGIDKQTSLQGEIQIGPTSLGMVRLYVRTEEFELPMDFEPEEAEEIASELVEAAQRARESQSGGKQSKSKKPGNSKNKSR